MTGVQTCALPISPYNGTYHRSIKMQPKHVRRIHQPVIRQRLYGETYKRRVKAYEYNIGDRVLSVSDKLRLKVIYQAGVRRYL